MPSGRSAGRPPPRARSCPSHRARRHSGQCRHGPRRCLAGQHRGSQRQPLHGSPERGTATHRRSMAQFAALRPQGTAQQSDVLSDLRNRNRIWRFDSPARTSSGGTMTQASLGGIPAFLSYLGTFPGPDAVAYALAGGPLAYLETSDVVLMRGDGAGSLIPDGWSRSVESLAGHVPPLPMASELPPSLRPRSPARGEVSAGSRPGSPSRCSMRTSRSSVPSQPPSAYG